MERARYRCEIGPALMYGPADAVAAGRRCRGNATAAHHIEPRGMGGHGNHDPANGKATCDPCHEWVESHRQIAYQLGLLARH